jgi:dienelactone hydrolase
MPESPSPLALTRRELLRQSLLGALLLTGPAAAASRAPDQAAPPPRPSLPPLNRTPLMMQHHFMARLRDRPVVTSEPHFPPGSPAAAAAHADEVARRIASCFGPWPERTPLNVRITDTHPRDGYRIENVVFESRPGFFVTANLYVPAVPLGTAPGVIGTCGHAPSGKAAPTYQSFAQGLARLGYLVLIFDPIGIGERSQYVTPQFRPIHGDRGVNEHLLAGNQMFLVGESFVDWNVWDGMRAIDYLWDRPELDRRHLGITGNSGGGTLATWLCALDPRLTMAAPACFVTRFQRNLENELPADTEQCPRGALAAGLEHADFFAPFAPRPLLLLGQEGDYFDVRGFEEAARTIGAHYAGLGASDKFSAHVAAGPHGYSRENREAMYHWFNRVTGRADQDVESALVLESPETLQCVPEGQVAALGGRSLPAHTRARSEELARRRAPLAGPELVQAVSGGLRVRELPTDPTEYRILRPVTGLAYPRRSASVYAVQTEPGIEAFVYLLTEQRMFSRPRGRERRATLYVSHRSADAELRTDPWVRDLAMAEAEGTCFACDSRGLGESQPNTCGVDFLHPYGPDYFYAIHGIMFDRPYPTQRTEDLLRVLRWLAEHGYRDIHLVARGWGTIPATFAAMLSPHVRQVTLKHALSSFASVAETEAYVWPLSSFVPAVLRTWDLPDCYRWLAAKDLRLIEPLSGGEAVPDLPGSPA